MSYAISNPKYLALPRPQQTWLVEELLPVSGSLIIHGNPKVGKSFLALQLCESLVLGRPWFGFGVPRPIRVAYYQLDTPRSLWTERIDELIESGHALNHQELFTADRESLDFWPFNILVPSHAEILRQDVAELTPAVVVVDTLRACHLGADENDASAMTAVLSHLVAAVQPAALVIVHHSVKPHEDVEPDVINASRGSSAVTGAVDGVVMLTSSGLEVDGRAVKMGKHKVRLNRLNDGSWAMPDHEKAKALARQLVEDRPGSIRSRAMSMAAELGITVEAARHRLRRAI